ncbi:jg21299 [Pararge aegeria aegeria]|uniref:Jg21299 protein n=1 Tax=Pararge aegeria aegeria TaxID=348720 RepID=A0A8S4SK03_9NEOP|nr:jg21299 [Pararge aegeria aegeria]
MTPRWGSTNAAFTSAGLPFQHHGAENNMVHQEAVHADASLTQGERQMSNAEAECASLSLVPRSRLHFKVEWNASERGNAAYVISLRAAGSIEL